jgi:hypothetical protein
MALKVTVTVRPHRSDGDISDAGTSAPEAGVEKGLMAPPGWPPRTYTLVLAPQSAPAAPENLLPV